MSSEFQMNKEKKLSPTLLVSRKTFLQSVNDQCEGERQQVSHMKRTEKRETCDESVEKALSTVNC